MEDYLHQQKSAFSRLWVYTYWKVRILMDRNSKNNECRDVIMVSLYALQKQIGKVYHDMVKLNTNKTKFKSKNLNYLLISQMQIILSMIYNNHDGEKWNDIIDELTHIFVKSNDKISEKKISKLLVKYSKLWIANIEAVKGGNCEKIDQTTELLLNHTYKITDYLNSKF